MRGSKGSAGKSSYYQIGISEYCDNPNWIKQTDLAVQWTLPGKPYTKSIPRAVKRTRCQPFKWWPSVKLLTLRFVQSCPALEGPQLPKEQWQNHLPKAGLARLHRERPRPHQLNWRDLQHMLVSPIHLKKKKKGKNMLSYFLLPCRNKLAIFVVFISSHAPCILCGHNMATSPTISKKLPTEFPNGHCISKT